MKKVLVTGATGFIGSNLVKRLVEMKIEVYVLIRPESKSNKRLENIKGLKCIKGSPEDLINMNDLPNFDMCFNLAAYGVKFEEQNIDEMLGGNIKYLISMIEFASKNKTHLLIHTGSCFEYGINECEKISEKEMLDPQTLYSSTKAAGTLIGNTYARVKNVNMITVRPFGVYGPGEASYRLLPQLINAATNNIELKMTEGEQVRDYLFVDDLVDAYIKLAQCDNLKMYDIYNISSSEPITIKQFVYNFCEVYGCDKKLFKLGDIPYRPNEVMNFVGDNSKIKECTKWRPKFSIKEGIEKSIKWYRNNNKVL